MSKKRQNAGQKKQHQQNVNREQKPKTKTKPGVPVHVSLPPEEKENLVQLPTSDEMARLEAKHSRPINSYERLRDFLNDQAYFSIRTGHCFMVYEMWVMLLVDFYRAKMSDTSPTNPYTIKAKGSPYQITDASDLKRLLQDLQPFFDGSEYKKITSRSHSSPFEARWTANTIIELREKSAATETEISEERIVHTIDGEEFSFSLALFQTVFPCDPSCEMCSVYRSKHRHKRDYWDETQSAPEPSPQTTVN